MTGSSNRGSLNLNSNQGRVTENNRRIDLEACLPHNMCKSGSSSNYSETNNASGSSLSVSSGPPNPSLTSHVGPLNPRSEVGMARVSPGFSPRIAENPGTNSSLGSNLGPRGTTTGHSSTLESMPPAVLSIYPNNNRNQHLIHSNEVNNPDYHPMIVSASRTTNFAPEQIDWSFDPEILLSSRNHSSGSRVGPSSGGQSSSAHRDQTSQDRQRLSGIVPWYLLPRIESDSGNQRRSPSVLLPFGSSSSYETATTGRGQRQSDQRPAAFSMDMPGGDINGRNVLSAVDSRHRLDYMLIDPLLNVFAELHDRDIRLNIDDMSYESIQLSWIFTFLILDERKKLPLGNCFQNLFCATAIVGVGGKNRECEPWAKQGKNQGSMKQREYEGTHASPDLESCCICQEDYVAGDYIGKLGCGHEFHTSCIERWLILKNVCPVCKMTAVETS
ncbi:LOW QUALITY PROTEIN: hypothetical protein DH2020_023894 [Rehmannia glutinosa]|uniref:RING-type E3 ubiquitin transferase n=1 Tax=Rehmannia glutinosa TaxID=99300 RepID=A0ABR0W9V8_REHGL